MFNETAWPPHAHSLAAAQAEVLDLALAGHPVSETLAVLARAAEAPARSGGRILASVLLRQAEAPHWRPAASGSLPPACNEAMAGLLNSPLAGSCGAAAAAGEGVVVTDVEADPRCVAWRALARQHGLRSWSWAPILSRGGAVQGLLALYRDEVHEPGAEERAGLALLARTAALLLQRPAPADPVARPPAAASGCAGEERYRLLFESIDEGFCMVDVLFDAAGRARDCRIAEANPAFLKYTGLQDPIGRTVRDLMPGHEDRWCRLYGSVATTGQPVRFVDEATATGRWFNVSAMRVGGPGSTRVALLFSDITPQKQAQDELSRLAAELAETDRRKDEFLAVLAHELRNPLAPLRNGLQIMRAAPHNAAAVAKARDMMERQLGNMVRLVNDMLDVARISSGKLEIKTEHVLLQTVLTAAVETSLPMIEAGRHELSVDIEDTQTLLVEVDARRLAQVVSNLLNNAAKYTPSGGRIELKAHATGDEAVITVKDSGTGIAPEVMPKLFNIFSQVRRDTDRSQGGLGVGLSLVRRLVELHGGRVSAHSPGPGLGSTFTVQLPLPAPRGAMPGVPPVLPRLRILVADTDADEAERLSQRLRNGGHVTLVAHDGAQALKMAPGFAPHAAFVDMGLSGLDGGTVARSLRDHRATRDVLLAALVPRGMPSVRAAALAAGFDCQVNTPLEPQDIDAVLTAWSVVRGAGSHAPLPAS